MPGHAISWPSVRGRVVFMCRFLHGGVLASLLLVGAIMAEGPACAQSDAELKALNQSVIELYRAGKYGEAIPLAQRGREVYRYRPLHIAPPGTRTGPESGSIASARAPSRCARTPSPVIL